MINMLIGQPGGGKSYEAVAYHVLPALKQGRKVITNLPLNLEEIAKVDANYLTLIDIKRDSVTEEIKKRSFNPFHRSWDSHTRVVTHRPFASIADYGDEWRHPETGSGPLYVIDECHLCLPRQDTQKAVEEWFSLHRHELSDVLLITQSYGKVCKPICDMVQVLYRVKKATAFGSNDSYIRKVQDGIGGDVVNTGIRQYKPEYFKFYKSHTKSSEAGQELAAKDIVPFWKRWPMIGAGICFFIIAVMLLNGHSINPMKSFTGTANAAAPAPSKPPVVQYGSHPPSSQVSPGIELYTPDSAVSAAPVTSQVTKIQQAHPFEGLTLHIVSLIESEKKWLYSFSVDQNGQPQFHLTQTSLEQSGYTVEKLSECSARIRYKEIAFYATCDAPRVNAVNMASNRT